MPLTYGEALSLKGLHCLQHHNNPQHYRWHGLVGDVLGLDTSLWPLTLLTEWGLYAYRMPGMAWQVKDRNMGSGTGTDTMLLLIYLAQVKVNMPLLLLLSLHHHFHTLLLLRCGWRCHFSGSSCGVAKERVYRNCHIHINETRVFFVYSSHNDHSIHNISFIS